MDLTFSDQHEAFRAEAREWLRANVPSGLASMNTAAGFAAHKAWERTLFDARWAVVSWPEEYGGRGADLIEWLIFEEEYWAAGAPGRVTQNGIFLLAPTIFEHGTKEQQDRYLPKMAAGEELWAQGWSEPDAGSDLAGLRSRAVQDGDDWVLTGQKTWSTRGVFCDWLFGLFRSDPEAQRHHGLTYFLVPLDAEGVTVRPISGLHDDVAFAEVFLEEVRVPSTDVLGGVNEGWRVAMATASSERGLTLRSPGRFMAAADRLIDLYRRRPDEHLREEVARAWMNAEAYRLLTFQAVSRMLQTGQPMGAEASLMKLWWSELDVHLNQTAQRLVGADAELGLDSEDAPDDGRWLDGWLFSLAGPIYAGTNEIQRNVVAERVLGLPRVR
ncbi:MAG: acyl-CoA dehydrogenase family protein [Acidimicrobiales bacterium]